MDAFTAGLRQFATFYEYWEANGGNQRNDGLFAFYGLTSYDNFTEEAQKNISADRPMTLAMPRARQNERR